MTEWLISAAAPALGWVVYVEYRLGQLIGMKQQVDKIEDRVDKIYDHLLAEKDERTAAQTR